MEIGVDQMNGTMPQVAFNTSAKLPARPKDIRVVQVVGGYTVSKNGGDQMYYPLEVCVSLDEVKAKVDEFFMPPTPEEAQTLIPETDASLPS